MPDTREGDLDSVTDRLRLEFTSVPHPRVRRCVADTWRCAAHLGYDVTPGLVERVARERLHAVEKSRPAPPSGRREPVPSAAAERLPRD
ncbi:hypothetical protein [Marinitenerispora sediminis]|uniref:Uncharacterized protein n=1 Tax=Marinitenerispora sediminis TaxID=1931232 RepID=A0A368TAT7_9ACTN|nr:hypothetical protein [Marinitenerispora sediminis]RCV56974.1 hypothetical protein DEF28_02555 [Marinitenerispora sediminis]RCV60180.1 hypothetical protein DEF23_05290 [Marinitenerispora sediminis]RCV62115.1 hypothetical protein DEF24_02395 [Marinitenerispora sediminis]